MDKYSRSIEWKIPTASKWQRWAQKEHQLYCWAGRISVIYSSSRPSRRARIAAAVLLLLLLYSACSFISTDYEYRWFPISPACSQINTEIIFLPFHPVLRWRIADLMHVSRIMHMKAIFSSKLTDACRYIYIFCVMPFSFRLRPVRFMHQNKITLRWGAEARKKEQRKIIDR